MSILISSQKALEELCSSLKQAARISLDTEFERRDTYFAKLALVQLSYNEKIYIIDPLTLDITALWNSIMASNATIIIHSGRQDLEIIYNSCKRIPSNIFDTQVAASFCGYRASTSYAELCSSICGIKLDKTHQASNWIKRPISPAMLDYAAVDVLYLEEIYQHLSRIIEAKNLSSELAEATNNAVLNLDLYRFRPEAAWSKIKFRDKSQKFLQKIQVLAAFREESVVEINIPRRFFATDEQLIKICYDLPINEQMLKSIRGLRPWIHMPKYSSKLFDLCAGLGD